jgi:hypothetical protein
LSDVPTWSSSTSYYAGRRDGGWDDAGPHDTTERAAPVTQRNEHPAGYAPRYAPQPPNGYAPPPPNGYGSQPPNGYAGNGRGRIPANGHPPDGYVPYGHANEWGSPAPARPDEYDDGFDRRYGDGPGGPADSARAYPTRSAARAQARATTNQRGLPGWGALLVLIAIAVLGDIIDSVAGNTAQGGFNIAIVVASIVAILLVRHRDMFPIVVAPPLVYFISSAGMLYINSGGLHNRKSIIDHAANWLVYGFPAIAGASAAVLIIAGVRLVIGK